MLDFVSHFHVPPDSPLHNVSAALELLRPMAQWLGARDPLLSRWYLAGGRSATESRRHRAFVDEVNTHEACLAVLAQQAKRLGEVGISLWNGEEDIDVGASMHLLMSHGPFTSTLTVMPGGSAAMARTGDFKDAAQLLTLMVQATRPECAHVYHQSGYGNKQTFKDRPGVGWMLYLPRVFTPQDLPEAGALLPALDGEGCLGTIIVSVTDAVFDDNNPEHLKLARDIEVRMVNNDWLPTWRQMVRLPV